MDEDRLLQMAAALMEVRGVAGVMLGGSRARGAHAPGSDWDLGVYYRGDAQVADTADRAGGADVLDIAALAALAAAFTGEPVEVAGPGGWGPWVDGGAWLTVDGAPVDWILRGLDRVRRVWSACREGRYEVGVQPGHPLGFWSPVYPGEVVLGRVLADPGGELGRLQEEIRDYPAPLRTALVEAAWEASFCVEIARKSAKRGDVTHVALCLSRAFGVLAQSVHAWHGAWCLNEKGAVRAAARLPVAPPDFAERVGVVLGACGATAGELSATVDAADRLVAETRSRLAS